jgi:hypothetical protein
MLRLGIDEPLAEGGGSGLDRPAQRLEKLGIAILRGVFQQLGEGIDQRQRIVADVVQLVPQAV